MGKFKYLSVGVLFLALSSCTSKHSTTSSAVGVDPNTQYAGTIGIKNVHQFAWSLTAALGIPMEGTFSLGNVTTKFSDIANLNSVWFSPDSDIYKVNSSTLLTMMGTVGVACRVHIEQEAKLSAGERKVLAGVDFTKGPSGVTDSVAEGVITKYSERFWRRAPDSEEMGILKDVVEESISAMLDESKMTDPATLHRDTVSVILTPCTVIGSSIESLIQ